MMPDPGGVTVDEERVGTVPNVIGKHGLSAAILPPVVLARDVSA